MEKSFKLTSEEILKLIEPIGYCIATDKITVNGELIDYMVRENPENNSDSGWQFYSGTEDQEYMDEADNLSLYDVNTIANYDKAIIPFLQFPIGSKFERIPGTNDFKEVSD